MTGGPSPYLALVGDGYAALDAHPAALDEASYLHHQAHPQHHHQQPQPTAVLPGGGQFGILAPTTVPHEFTHGTPDEGLGERNHGPFGKLVPNPPDLEAWRERLFNVDELIVLTNDQFETYFPHVDNVYSHRSTQRYKRKPFISHYWDCRMKGRPPGTPKSDDPNKKKRKRSARERDLCDVKIKITEYSPGAQIQIENTSGGPSFISPPLEVGSGQRFWTIQRVNGNGGNGKGDGVAGPHRHTLAKSDEIKKNSIQRHLTKQEKETKKTTKPPQRKATGAALVTVKRHSKEADLKFYAACFCPFSQRAWIALEAKGLAYQYVETTEQVPLIRQGEWACTESAIILEYLEDLDKRVPLLPSDPRLRANCRVWMQHIDAHIVPAFFALLHSHQVNLQENMDRLHNAITALVLAADERGPFFLGRSLSLVDVHFVPFALRLSRVLVGWPEPVPRTRWARWLEALEGDGVVRGTVSGGEVYGETREILAQRGTVPGFTVQG